MKTVEEAARLVDICREQLRATILDRQNNDSGTRFPTLDGKQRRSVLDQIIDFQRSMYEMARDEFEDAAALAAVETARAAFDVLQQPRAAAVPDNPAEISNYAAGFIDGAQEGLHTVARLLDARGEHAAADMVLEYAQTRKLRD